LISLSNLFELKQNIKILYHASHLQNLKEIKNDFNITNNGDDYGKKWIYAGNKQQIVCAFTFPWNDGMGIQFGSKNWNSGKPKYIIKIPKKHTNLISHQCSIYTIPIDGFKEVKGGLKGEYRSNKTNVKVIDEVKFKTAKQCMEKFNVEIINI